MRPVRNVFQKLSRTEQRREGVVAYLWDGECGVRTTRTENHEQEEAFKEERGVRVEGT
jgi:hypothetical protein